MFSTPLHLVLKFCAEIMFSHTHCDRNIPSRFLDTCTFCSSGLSRIPEHVRSTPLSRSKDLKFLN